MKVSKSAVCTSVLALGGLLAAVTPALATSVTFTSTGAFSAGGGSSVLNAADDGANVTGTASLTFQGYNATSPQGPASGAGSLPDLGVDLGNFASAGIGNLNATGSFTLTVNQSNPLGVPPTGGLTSTISGTILDKTNPNVKDTSTAAILFASDTFTIAGVTYTLDNVTLQSGGGYLWQVAAPNSLLQASLMSATPEPTFYGLTGLGFAGLLGMAIRRKRQAA